MPAPTPTDSATFGARTMAIVIDSVLLKLLYLTLLILAAGRLFAIPYADPADLLVALCFYLVLLPAGFFFLSMTYFTIFHAWSGQTIGKMVLGIRVVTDNDMPAGLGAAFLRWCGYLMSLAPFATGFLWVAVDRDRRAWHDRLARTRVIMVENS